MRKPYFIIPRTQRGATLVIALLILVMIMMYGIPAAMDSMQNERMAGNTRNRDLAFQAAEYALNKAETWIKTQTYSSIDALAPAAKLCSDSPDDVDPVSGDGIFPNGECHANDFAYWQSKDKNWWTSNGVNPSSSIDSDLVAAQPRYVVERMPNIGYCKPSNSPPPCTLPNVIANKAYYRITARGVGKDNNAIVILQTMYEFTQ